MTYSRLTHPPCSNCNWPVAAGHPCPRCYGHRWRRDWIFQSVYDLPEGHPDRPPPEKPKPDWYTKQLERVAFDLASGSWDDPKKAMEVMRSTLIDNVEGIVDPRIRETVQKWRAMQRLGHQKAETEADS